MPDHKVAGSIKKTITNCAPGKVILTGEHSVVYKKPAIAMPVNRHTTCQVTPMPDQTDVAIDLPDVGRSTMMKWETIQSPTFISDYNITAPTGKGTVDPMVLVMYILYILDQKAGLPKTGLQITVQSSIPIGRGLGSSAAFIVSIFRAMVDYAGLTLSNDVLLNMAWKAENLIHGKSSGLDIHVSFYDSVLLFDQSVCTPMDCPIPPFHLIDTGPPQSTTRQTVKTVADHVADPSIWDRFGGVSNAILTTLTSNQGDDIGAGQMAKLFPLIKQNHELLCDIGVVPMRVQQLINDIEQAGGVAKITGAGSVTGIGGGMVMAFGMDNPTLNQLCDKYGHTPLTDLEG